MTVHAASDATAETVKSLIHDLSWVGGCRDPESDPGFESLAPSNITIKRCREKDRR